MEILHSDWRYGNAPLQLAISDVNPQYLNQVHSTETPQEGRKETNQLAPQSQPTVQL